MQTFTQFFGLRSLLTKYPYSTNKVKYLAALLLLTVFGYFSWSYFGATKVEILYTLNQVKRETLTSYVSSSGQIIVKNQVDLKFQNTGTVTSVRVNVGDTVKKGQVLASIDSRSALVSLKQAEASLASAKASYKKITDGATAQDLLSIQSSLEDSKVSLTTAKQNAVTKMVDTYTQVNDIVVTKTNVFFTNANTTPAFSIPGYPLNNQVVQASIEQQRKELNALLPLWKSAVDSLSIDGDIDSQLTKNLSYLNKTATYLDNLLSILNTTSASDNTISSYRSTVSSARSSVSSLISSIIVLQQGIAQAESQVKQNQSSYDLKKSPPTAEDLTIAQSQVINAEASYLNAQNNYANTSLVAPFDAVVGASAIKVGDQASSATLSFTLITANQLVDLSLNEVDATKIKVGQKATLTFDAIPDLILAGTVAEVSPLGTVTQGVVTYNVKISLDTVDEKIKAGMSVTANIITSVREDVLALPSEAIKTSNNTSYVEVPQSGFTSASSSPVVTLPSTPSRVTVTQGISNDTKTEIINGLSEGDWVVVKTTTPGAKKVTTTQQTGFSALGGGGRAAGR